MKEKFNNLINNKYKTLVFISVPLILLAIIVSAVLMYNNNKNEKEITLLSNEITQYVEKFDVEEDRNNKFNILKELNENQSKYDQKDVINKYDNQLEVMKKWFTNNYDKVIVENTLQELDKINDKEAINKTKENLTLLTSTMDAEKEIVLNSEEIVQYTDKINVAIKSYDGRLAVIKVEEEKIAQAKIEAEKVAAAAAAQSKIEEEKVAQAKIETQNNYVANEETNTTQNSENANNNYQAPASKAKAPVVAEKPSAGKHMDISRLEHVWNFNLDTGEKIPGTDKWIDRSTGDNYDENGNFLGNGIW